jgi:hypothetical protein
VATVDVVGERAVRLATDCWEEVAGLGFESHLLVSRLGMEWVAAGVRVRTVRQLELVRESGTEWRLGLVAGRARVCLEAAPVVRARVRLGVRVGRGGHGWR